jgi:hypothetical protein
LLTTDLLILNEGASANLKVNYFLGLMYMHRKKFVDNKLFPDLRDLAKEYPLDQNGLNALKRALNDYGVSNIFMANK